MNITHNGITYRLDRDMQLITFIACANQPSAVVEAFLSTLPQVPKPQSQHRWAA